MSAETTLYNLMSSATSNAFLLSALSADLVTNSVAALENDLVLSKTPVAGSEAGVDTGGSLPVVTSVAKPGFPNLPNMEISEVPAIQGLPEVEITIDDITYPSLTFPAFSYGNTRNIPSFDKAEPQISDLDDLPDVPDTALPEAPSLLTPNDIPFVGLQSPEITLHPITSNVTFDPNTFSSAFSSFKNDILLGYGDVPGIETLIVELDTWAKDVTAALTPALLEVLAGVINNKYEPVLAFNTKLRERLTARLNEEQARVEAALSDNSGWDIPVPVALAQRAMASKVMAAWKAYAEQQVDIKSAEVSLSFFEVCGSVIADLTNLVQKLKASEIEYLLDAHKYALIYAKSMIDALLTEYEITNFTLYDITFKKDEAKLKVFEAELEVAMLQYEVAKANIQVEEAKQERDAILLEFYQTNLATEQTKVSIYAALVSAVRNEMEHKRIAVESFALQVRAFSAKIDAYEAKLSAQIAEIDGDVAKVEGQLKRVAGYEGEVQAFSKLIDAKRTIMRAEYTRNKAVIDEYKLRVTAAVAPIEKDLIEDKYALAKFNVNAADVLTDAKITLERAKVDQEYIDKRQDEILRAYELTQERNLKLIEAELNRLKIIAESNARGASIMADMARGAMSAVNGIAVAALSETE